MDRQDKTQNNKEPASELVARGGLQSPVYGAATDQKPAPLQIH